MMLVLCTPMYSSGISPGYLSSVLQLQDMCNQLKLSFTYRFLTNESLITRGRNRLCKSFLDIPDATHLLFIDADIEFRPQDILDLLNADKDVIGAPYCCKALLWDRVAKMANDGITDPNKLCNAALQPVLNIINNNVDTSSNIASVYEIGTGILLIKRSVLELMIEKNPNNYILMDTPSDLNCSIEERKYYVFFDTLIDGTRYLSEDYVFCKKCRELDIKIHLLLNANTKHWGTYAYEYKL